MIDIPDRDHPEYQLFYGWFKRLLHKTGSCFERDVLRGCKHLLWIEWKNQCAEDATTNTGGTP